jgi:hypothetical protein
MHNCPPDLMHYALCMMHAFCLRTNMVPTQRRCIMRFMQYNDMHYEILYCISYYSPTKVRISTQ